MPVLGLKSIDGATYRAQVAEQGQIEVEDMTERTFSGRTGLWLIGSRGSVATTAITGASAVAAGLAPSTGIVTMSEAFADVPLPALKDMVFGGHDLVETPLAVRASRLVDGGVLPTGVPEAVADRLAAAEDEMESGITYREARSEPLAAVRRVASDLRSFRERHALDHVVVLNLCSTEPPAEPHPAHEDPDALQSALNRGLGVLPPSSLYALAAIQEGCAFIDFTPSTGARLPALEALAEAHGVPLGGSDGKTGETLIKTALAPAFSTRALRVRSWAGANLLGGGDGEALADPVRAESKMRSKGRCLEEILGYPVESPVRIDYLRDLGEWKTAWDNITFEGFLGVRMRMQFTWEGCDSSLAAPLVLDLARLGALALSRGDGGIVPELGFFFKDPAGSNEHAIERQFDALCDWAAGGVRA
jgi:myo-inositol-1-phosphate synthase